MFSGIAIGLLHQVTQLLLQPVIIALLGFLALALYDIGICFGERFGGIARLVKANNKAGLLQLGKRRIERADFIARITPMLGLMGTLIPLGPGLAALGDGELSILTTAMMVAFDTTVVGLLAGVIGFVLGRLRRRWYDQALNSLEVTHG